MLYGRRRCVEVQSVAPGEPRDGISSPAIGQRVWNTQPEGGVKGEGISPLSARGARAALYQRVGDRRGVEQRLGIGMQRPGIELVAVGDFGNAARDT